MNSSLTFSNSREMPQKLSRIIKFISVYLLVLLLNMLLTYIFYDILNMNKYIIPLAALVITMPINFLLNKFWVFSIKDKSATNE
jgi:putative flippase GtrA